MRKSINATWSKAIIAAFVVMTFLAPINMFGQLNLFDTPPGFPDLDNRAGTVAPNSTQLAIVSNLGATARWNQFGTPKSLTKHGGYLATGLSGDTAVSAAQSWIDANKALFRLGSISGLTLYGDSKIAQSNGHAVHFRQAFGGLPTTSDGIVTVGITGTPESGWNIAYVSSSLTGDTVLGAQPQISPIQAWAIAAADVGRSTPLIDIGSGKTYRGWTTFGARGFAEIQRARLVAVPTPLNGVRPAFETLIVDNQFGRLTGFNHLVDAQTGAILTRRNLVHQSHPPSATFTGTVPLIPEGTCDVDKGPWVIDPGESVASISYAAFATLGANDMVLHLKQNGVIVQSQDTGTSPEGNHYAPSGGVPAGSYTVSVCDFADGTPWLAPSTYDGTIVFNSVAPGGVPYPPKWQVFPAYATPATLPGFPWNLSSSDIRKIWCWDSIIQGQPVAGCQDEVQNLAARVPWDYEVLANAPTNTTVGNAANSAEAWTNPLAPGPTGHRPQSPTREYTFPWTNAWYTSGCDPANLTPQTPVPTTVSNDISPAVVNLFMGHNRMHDWSYFLGFTEENWNAQQNNFGNAGAELDPVEGEAQAGALNGGYPAYLGRDNANMLTLPDGIPSITNMYLWQPLRASFYAPCVDGDYDMGVIGHEYGHMIENRMIGKGGGRAGHHAGAMGESSGDLLGMEVVNEFGFVPVSGENPYAVGVYDTGNKQRGIRNYGMNVSPLNFSNMGYDAFAADPVHANGEIWSATNFEIRQALVTKYNATYPASDAALQRRCADGLGNPVSAPTAPENCPGNRRWIQIMFDAYLIMPIAPSMLDAREAYLAADLMRFGGANQADLWLAFAHRGLGQGATSSNANSSSDTDPKPDFASMLHTNANVTFAALDPDNANASITNARIYVGQYEARTSPVADTDPTTNTTGTNNLDDQAQFAPGTYEFVVHAPGYGHVKFTRTFTAGQSVTVNISMPTNWASSTKGATAVGDGSGQASLIDDTETTNWTSTVAPVAGKQVTVDLPGTTARTINRVQVSAFLNSGMNRFQALRQFRIDVSTDGTNFSPAFTSAADAFPGVSPRPTLPDLLLRSFTLPTPVSATHVRLVVLTNQCTGQTDFHGVQDSDIPNPTDCRGVGEPVGTDPAGQAPPAQAATVRVAELQVFSSAAPNVCSSANLALGSAGSGAVASTTHSSGRFPALAAINGDRTGATWGTATGGWNDNTRNAYPDMFGVNFPVAKTINQINVFTLQNNWTTAGEPTPTTPATGEGILDFLVQVCYGTCDVNNNTGWVTIPSGAVTGNDRAMRVFNFSEVTTGNGVTQIRVVVTNARNNWSRIVELEAYRNCP